MSVWQPGPRPDWVQSLHEASDPSWIPLEADEILDREAVPARELSVLERIVGEMERRDQEGRSEPRVVVVLDELNKYAPREGVSPLKEMLIDIAQRGRSLGVLLVGAQQTASRVASEVMENAALKVAGRLDAAEAERSEYGWMLPSTRARARLLKPGTMVVSQPALPVPLVVEFPFPPWATRKEEVDTSDSDPFAGL